MTYSVLYKSANLTLNSNGNIDSKVGIVTFSPWNAFQKEAKYGFFSRFLDDSNFYVIHVMPKGNDWYQYEDMPLAINSVNENLRSCDKVILLGSSMGGYAALLFSSRIRSDFSVSISPQFSINPLKNDWDNRWISDARRLIFIDDEINSSISSSTQSYVFYDPYSKDYAHVEKFKKKNNLNFVRVPFSGHPSGYELTESGFLSKFLSLLASSKLKNDQSFNFSSLSLLKKDSLYHYLSLFSHVHVRSKKRKRIIAAKIAAISKGRSLTGRILVQVMLSQLEVSIFDANYVAFHSIRKHFLEHGGDPIFFDLKSLEFIFTYGGHVNFSIELISIRNIRLDSLLSMLKGPLTDEYIFNAVAYLKNYLLEKPFDVKARKALLQARICGDDSLIISTLFESLALKVDDPYFLPLLAKYLYIDQRYEESIYFYKCLLEKDQLDITLYRNIANVYFVMKSFLMAEKTLLAGLKIQPNELNLLRILIEVYSKLGKLGDAHIYAQKGLEISPDNKFFRSVLRQG